MPTKKPLLILDPGHGGIDPGAVNIGDPRNPNDDVTEAKLAYQLCMTLKTIFESTGWDVMLTRPSVTKGKIALASRYGLANAQKADLFISMHLNASENVKANGFEVYHDNNSVRGKTWGAYLEAAMKKTLPNYKFRAVRPDNESQHHDLSVLSKTAMPAILIEAGFISNAADLEFVRSNGLALCSAIAGSTQKFYEAWKKAGANPVPFPLA